MKATKKAQKTYKKQQRLLSSSGVMRFAIDNSQVIRSLYGKKPNEIENTLYQLGLNSLIEKKKHTIKK